MRKRIGQDRGRPARKKGREIVMRKKNFERERDGGIDGTPMFAPKTAWVTLGYTDNTIARNHATFTFLAFRQRPTGLYDPDPALGSGSISGFAEWSNLYRKYLVMKFVIVWVVTNLEAFPITICTAPANFDINSQITDSSTALDLGEMADSQVRQLSQAGGMDRAKIKYCVDCPTFWGNSGEYEDSSAFCGTGAANPPSLIFAQFAVAASNALVNGINSTLKIKMLVKWYSRQTPFDRTFRALKADNEVVTEKVGTKMQAFLSDEKTMFDKRLEALERRSEALERRSSTKF